jgi:fused signal recognition particle receptor
MSWFNRLSGGLKKTTDSLGAVFTKRRLDAETLEQLEEQLILADMGAVAAASIVEEISRGRVNKDISETEIKELLAAAIAKRLEPYAIPFVIPAKA